MEKVAVFLDYANLDHASASAGCEVDFEGLLKYVADDREGRFLQAAFAYVPKDPRQEHARDFQIKQLWRDGFVVKSKVGTMAGQSYKCDFDVEMTLDIAKVAYDIKPDIIVLISGDSDFVPVVLEMRNKGIRVEVASFGNSMSSLLKERCSGFIDLDYVADLTDEVLEEAEDIQDADVGEESISVENNDEDNIKDVDAGELSGENLDNEDSQEEIKEN